MRYALWAFLAVLMMLPGMPRGEAADKGGSMMDPPATAAPVTIADAIVGNKITCGAELSGARSSTVNRIEGGGTSFDFGADGFMLGIGLGCDYTLPRSVVFIGGWARYDFADVGGEALGVRMGQNDVWSAGGRAGFHLNKGTDAYLLLGVAGTDWEVGAVSWDKTALVYGAGVEVDIASLGIPMALFGQWEHYDWQKETIAGATAKPDTDQFRVGVKIKFGKVDN